jgi:hypothetical protein
MAFGNFFARCLQLAIWVLKNYLAIVAIVFTNGPTPAIVFTNGPTPAIEFMALDGRLAAATFEKFSVKRRDPALR